MQRVVTTVLSPAAAWSPVSLADLKAELDITDTATDALLTKWIRRAGAAIRQYCNRTFPVEGLRDTFLYERDAYPWSVPGGVMPLQLSRYPVQASPAPVVVVNDETLTVDADYVVDTASGQMHRIGPFKTPIAWTSLPITVDYSAGFSTTPPDVEDAAIRMVRGRWFARKRDPMLRREEVPGVISQEWWVASGDTGNMPADIADLLDNYRVPVNA